MGIRAPTDSHRVWVLFFPQDMKGDQSPNWLTPSWSYYIRSRQYPISVITISLPIVWRVDPLFVQFIFVQPVFIQRRFHPTLDSSNLLSSMTYIRPICFRPILVHFLFLSRNTKARFRPIFGVFHLRICPPPSVLIGFSLMMGSVLYNMGKIMKKISDFYF